MDSMQYNTTFLVDPMPDLSLSAVLWPANGEHLFNDGDPGGNVFVFSEWECSLDFYQIYIV